MRSKLALAQLPLVIGLLLVLVIGRLATGALGDSAAKILADNYRSVLAAQRMKEACERVDSGVMFVIAGHAAEGDAQIATNLAAFARELAVQEDNITEDGEASATTALRAAWTAYTAELARVRALGDPAAIREAYFRPGGLLAEFLAVKAAAEEVNAINQLAMTAKGDRAARTAERADTILIVAALAGLALAVIASSILTARLLRPLSVVEQTAQRLGEGDVAVRARVTSSDEIGNLARVVNTMADRIQRYRESSLGELLEAQLAAQAVIDSLPDPVLVLGKLGELRHANAAAAAILRVDPDQGARALDVLEPALRAEVERLRAHVAAGKGALVPKGLDDAIRAATPDGERMLLARGAPLYAQEGDVAGVTIVLQDVTRLHRFEELRDDLVATVAHELRTPLTSLRMAIHLLSEEVVGPLAPKQADLVFAAREECERLQAIVDELLDLSRIQADRIELRLADVDPEALVGDALDAERADAEARGATLTSEVLPQMPAVHVDRERLGLVFANLLGNAIRYGGTTVRVRARVVGRALRFEVRDDGPGIPPEYRATVFDKHVRVPGSPGHGAGIGLYIAREIVRAHGGEIGVEGGGEGGERGATFWFTVPLAAEEPSP